MRLKVLVELINADLKVGDHSFKELGKIIIVHQIYETSERFVLIAVTQERSSKERHVLYISDVRSVMNERDQDILQ